MQNLYELFGVSEHAKKLQEEGKTDELKLLDETLSKFILVKGMENLSEENRKKLADEHVEDGIDLYKFFSQHIGNFQERLKDYGRDFRTTIVAN